MALNHANTDYDTSLSCNRCSSIEIENKLNDDLTKVVHIWLCATKLTLHWKKVEYMIIGSRQKLDSISVNTNITIGDKEMTVVQT